MERGRFERENEFDEKGLKRQSWGCENLKKFFTFKLKDEKSLADPQSISIDFSSPCAQAVLDSSPQTRGEAINTKLASS